MSIAFDFKAIAEHRARLGFQRWPERPREKRKPPEPEHQDDPEVFGWYGVWSATIP